MNNLLGEPYSFLLKSYFSAHYLKVASQPQTDIETILTGCGWNSALYPCGFQLLQHRSQIWLIHLSLCLIVQWIPYLGLLHSSNKTTISPLNLRAEKLKSKIFGGSYYFVLPLTIVVHRTCTSITVVQAVQKKWPTDCWSRTQIMVKLYL